MELRHLRYYQEVCRTLSFSRAAENLHIAQPPLSRQIQQLESELNVTLITRTRPLALKKGRIDVGFGRIYLHDCEIEQLTIREEPLVAALPGNAALNDNPISLAELSQQRWQPRNR